MVIHFDRVPEPAEFQQQVRQPGLRWLEQHPDTKRPKNYWRAVRAPLADGFHNLCAYSAVYAPGGQVDHFVSWNECRSTDPSKAYEWSNYRFAAGWMNASKSKLRAAQLLDPFEVEDGWFRILLPSLQLVVDETRISAELLDRARFVLERLHLRDDERVIRQRRTSYELFQTGKLTLEGLREMAPLIARAVEAREEQGRGAGEG